MLSAPAEVPLKAWTSSQIITVNEIHRRTGLVNADSESHWKFRQKEKKQKILYQSSFTLNGWKFQAQIQQST